MTSKEIVRRRTQLAEMMGPGTIAIVPAASERLRNRDVHYPFRQDSDFFYLTGFPEPDAVAVIAPGRKQGEYVLFCRDRDPEKEVWDGYRAGPEGACRDYGADDAFPIEDIDDILPSMLERTERVYYTMGTHGSFDQRLIGWLNRLRQQARAGVHIPWELVSLEHLLHEMRLFKGRAELSLMRKAGKLAARTHRQAMQRCRPGMFEYELAAEYTYEFAKQGCEHAYPPIVGAGGNGCVLHYIENSSQMKDGELVLVDAGAELNHYASDITRTFPVGGRFSDVQRAVYEIVLAAQQAAIDAVVPGCNWNQPHEAAVQVLCQGLVDLGVLKAPVEQVIESQAYRRYYMHRTGHWLGMDVHDVGDYKVGDQWRALEPGMVLTVEPGLYLRASDDLDPKWHNIGIRIEDDVLVTRNGPEVLTRDAPKSIVEIESVMAR
ncbi:MAG: Xaa-Pro aminopeptidase [Pseudomonadota bacterium]|nr:Xaa-Pro aminopeptidase [Pseudomonadota bacterium]